MAQMIIQACRCHSEFQDKEYGRGNRAHTVDKDGNPRCTVCGPLPKSQARLITHGREHKKAIHG